MTNAIRSCVVSRDRLPQAELVRLTLDPAGHLRVGGPPGGRSAWVRPQLVLLRKLEKKPGMVSRSLRASPRSAEGLVEAVAAHLASKLARSLVRGWRSGRVRLPRPTDPPDAVRIVAWGVEPECARTVTTPWDATSMGCLMGRPRIHALVALPSRPTRALTHDLRQWQRLGYSPAPLAVPSSL